MGSNCFALQLSAGGSDEGTFLRLKEVIIENGRVGLNCDRLDLRPCNSVPGSDTGAG